ncbi:MAG: NACHT domain-containing protein [Chloroflexi bacterium]|nr:NACHT domain-containing protein [Chloroflexota bacterium]
MNKTNHFALMIDALTELAEEEQAHQTPPMPSLPTLKSVIVNASPLPREAAFLGLAEDGLPVLLNLYDAVPGPILICGDQACGKTALLQMIARATELSHPSPEVQYSVITQYPNEWNNFQNNQNNAGIYSTQDSIVKDLLYSLVTWAHNNKGDQQSVLLIIDDLEATTKLDQKTEQNLRWLLLRGPSRRVWPIITLNASRAQHMQPWLDFFRTRLFGRINDPADSRLVTGNSSKTLDGLIAGSEYTMQEGNKWLNFWAPILD